MDSFVDFILYLAIMVCAFIVLFLLFALAHIDGQEQNKKIDKRYEMCLKRDMQWVDENCISK